jgi:hypothetical protein
VTERTFYRCSLFLPVACTALAWTIIYVDRLTGYVSRSAEPLLSAAIFFGYGGLWGGVPYFVVSLTIFLMLQRAKGIGINYNRLLVLAPIFVVLVAYLLMIVAALVTRRLEVLGVLYFFTGWALIVGYMYVTVIWLCHKLALHFHWLNPQEL